MLYRESTNRDETIPRARRARMVGTAQAQGERSGWTTEVNLRYVILAAAANCLYGQPYAMLDVSIR